MKKQIKNKILFAILLLNIRFLYGESEKKLPDSDNHTETILQETNQKILTNEDFFRLYTIKQLETQNRIQLLQNKSNLKKLGSEIVQGKISGTLSYKTKVDMKKLAGLVYMTWENYSDEDGLVFNGQIITHANMAGNGHLEGIMKVSGYLNGTVYYDNLLIKDSKAGGGFYGVQMDNKDLEELPYFLYFEAIK